jgi:hypothetical protein
MTSLESSSRSALQIHDETHILAVEAREFRVSGFFQCGHVLFDIFNVRYPHGMIDVISEFLHRFPGFFAARI